MTVLGRKLFRDLLRLRGQVITIALVLACGVLAMIMLRATYASLLRSRDAYYADQRFADVFARLERAPESVAARLGALPGVARLHTRVVEDVMVPLAAEPEPVNGRIVSIPADGRPPLCGVLLVEGRFPAPGAGREAVLLESFARAHGLRPGDRLPAVLNGELRQLDVVGLAMSPEYIFPMAGFEMIADERRFVVIWMHRDAMAPIFRMEGAFNDVVFGLQPGAARAEVIAAVDRELTPYGGRHAVGRDKQLSNFVLTGELEQLSTLALILPTIFLAVAAFLVNVVISRLVYLERTQIAVLKALGKTRLAIALHYLGLVAAIVALGSVVGLALGVWTGLWMTDLYSRFFRFPSRVFHLSPQLVAVTLGVSLAAAVGGAVAAVLAVVRLPPAQAMRAPAPPSYRSSYGRLGRALGPAPMMIAREIARRPWRFLFSTAGIAMAVSIFILGRFSWNSFDWLMYDLFPREQRWDMTVVFARPLPERALRELAHLPGVLAVEGQRAVGARVRAGAAWRDSVVVGLPSPSELRRLVHARRRELEPRADGVILTDKLAEVLGVRPGDRVELELLEGEFATRVALVVGLIDEPFGMQVYARRELVDRLLREEPRVTSALLRVDARRADELRARLKELPAVLSTTTLTRIIDRYRAQTGESMAVITLIVTLSAAAIAVGVVYNNARIALSLRSRELASLRVLGMTRGEISSILLGELSLQVLAGIPLGLVLGKALAGVMAAASNPEALRFPLMIAPETYAGAALIALLGGLASALLVRRKLDQLDLVAVLKATE